MATKVFSILSLLWLTTVGATAEHLTHLTPIPAYNADGYDQAVFRSLIGESHPALWAILIGNIGPEFAVLLKEDDANADATSPNQKKWFLETAWAAEKIRLHRDTSVKRHTLEIEKPLALDLQKAFEVVLRQTRYPPEPESWSVADGGTSKFYFRPDLFGETRNPQFGVPAGLEELARLMNDVVECLADERAALLVKCAAKAKQVLHDAAPAKKTATKRRK